MALLGFRGRDRAGGPTGLASLSGPLSHALSIPRPLVELHGSEEALDVDLGRGGRLGPGNDELYLHVRSSRAT